MFAISPTDKSWFDLLKKQQFNSYVNFWTPTPWNIRKPRFEDRWYFLLKSPIRKIGGFGELIEYKNMTIADAWKHYGLRNGCESFENMSAKVQSYVNKHSKRNGKKDVSIEDYKIGCLILKNCQFWDEGDYLDPLEYNASVKDQVVTRKIFDRYDPFLHDSNNNSFQILSEPREDYKAQINQRRGQGKFQGLILKAYNNACCISGETCPELLDAAHIQNYLTESSNHVQNGLLLRVDIHRLYDNGLLYIDDQFNILVSPLLKGTMYWQYNRKSIKLPGDINDYPSKNALKSKLSNFRK